MREQLLSSRPDMIVDGIKMNEILLLYCPRLEPYLAELYKVKSVSFEIGVLHDLYLQSVIFCHT